jgi:hypothetical protein
MKSKLILAILCGGIFASAVSAFATADAENTVDSHVIARAGETESSPNYREIFVYSKEELKNVQIRFEKIESWTALETRSAADYKAYGTKSFFPVADGTRFFFRGTRPDGVRVTDLLTVSNVEGKIAIKAEGAKEESAEEVAKEAKAAAAAVAVTTQVQSSTAQVQTGSGNSWLDAVNAYRARNGRAAFTHSPHLYNISVQNAQTGRPHGYTGNRTQIWSGSSDINSSINMWMSARYYKSHGVKLMGGFSQAGVYCSGHGCTITFQ